MAKIIKDRSAIKAAKKAARQADRDAVYTQITTAFALVRAQKVDAVNASNANATLKQTRIDKAITAEGNQVDFMKALYHRGKYNYTSFNPFLVVLGNVTELQKLIQKFFPDKMKQFCKNNVFDMPMPISELTGSVGDDTFFSDFLTPAQEEDQRDIDEVDNAESVEVHSLTQWLKLTFPDYTQPQIDVIIKAYTNYNDDESSKEVIVEKFIQSLGTDRLSDFVNIKMPEMATEILSLL